MCTHSTIIPRNSHANPLCYRFLIVLVVNENIYCVSRTNRHGGVFTSSTVPIELYRIGSKRIAVFPLRRREKVQNVKTLLKR